MANVLAHIYAYVLWIIYMTPVVMILLFAFQNYPAIRSKSLNLSDWTLVNFFGTQDYEFLTNRGKLKTAHRSSSPACSPMRTPWAAFA